MKKNIVNYISLALLAILLGGSFSSLQAQNQRLKIITFNVKSFEFNDKTNETKFDLTPYANFLRGENADFIILNEVENRGSRQMKDGKYRDLVQELASQLNMFGIFGYSYSLNNKEGNKPEENYTYCQNEMYGNAILSRYPILSSKSVQLPRPAESADQRSVLATEVVLPSGDIISVVATHLDHVGGQEKQIEALISENIISGKYPTLLGGDLNLMTGAPALEPIKEKFDIAANHWVDWIFSSKNNWKKVGEQKVLYANSQNLSDHDAVLIEVELLNK